MKIFKTVCKVVLLMSILTMLLGVDGCPKLIHNQADLEQAFKEGGTWALYRDLPLDKPITLKSGVTLTLICSDRYGSNTLTYNGSDEDPNYEGINIEKGATLNLGNGDKVNVLTIAFAGAHFIITNGGTLSINDGVKFDWGTILNDGTMEMNGGTIHYGSVENYGSFKMNSGEIYGSTWENFGVYNEKAFTMTGGKIYDRGYGLQNSGGTYSVPKPTSNYIYSNTVCNIWSNGKCLE